MSENKETPKAPRTEEDPALEVESLKARLEEAEEVIRAIREGRVDALVACRRDGEHVYTMKTADRGYRRLVESMGQGAVILFGEDIFYCNRSFADMVKRSRESITGSRFAEYVSAGDRLTAQDFIRNVGKNNLRLETMIVSDDDDRVPVYLTSTPFAIGPFSGTCVVVTDLTEQKRTDRLLKEISERKHAEDALKENQQWLKFIQKAAGFGTFDWDLVAGRARCSQVYHEIFGLKQTGGLVGYEQWQDRIHPKDRDRVNDELQQLFNSGKKYSSEYRIMLGDGSVRFVHSTGELLRDDRGRVVRMIGGLRDITDRKRTEEQLRVILESISEIFWLRSPDKVLYVSPMYENIWGKTRESLYEDPTSFLDSIHPEDKPRVYKVFQGQYFDVSKFDEEYRIIRPDGSIRWIHARSFPVESHSEEDLRAGTAQDITDRKEAEVALLRSKKADEEHLAQLDGIVNQMTEGLVVFDPYGNLLEMNPAALKMHGFDSIENLRQNIDALKDVWQLYDIDGNVLPTEMWPVGRVLNGETFVNYEVYIRRRDTGATWWGSYGGSPIYDRNGNMILAILTLRDITTQREAEEIVRKTYKELEKTVAERTAALTLLTEQLRQLTMQLTVAEKNERQRIARILHDHLQQLLVGAKMQLEFLSQKVERDEQERLHKSVRMITESLKMSRSLTEELAPQALEHENVAKILEWVCDFMNETHGLKIDLKLADEMRIRNPDVRFFMCQAVRELLFNVVKHANTDSAQVRLCKDGSGHLEITVGDRGKGFDPSFIHKEESLGSHFGLFSLRERLSLLKGSMKLESTPGRGTECILILPLDEVEISEQPEKEIFFESARRARQADKSGEIRVLVVDDHDMVREAFVTLIETDPDIEVVGQADTGVEAVRAALSLVPDVILMDVNMPEMGGVEATRIIMSRLPEIRIIGLSIDDSRVTTEDMLAAGASGLISKESGSEVVLAAIRAHGRLSKRSEGTFDNS